MTNDECLMTKEPLSSNAEASIQAFELPFSFVIPCFVIILQYAFHFPIPLRIFADATCDLPWQFRSGDKWPPRCNRACSKIVRRSGGGCGTQRREATSFLTGASSRFAARNSGENRQCANR